MDLLEFIVDCASALDSSPLPPHVSTDDPNATPLKKELSITVPASASKSPSPAPTYCTTSPFKQKERIRCLFCGGDQCKRCSPTAHLALENPAIPKLHSSWINESIVAMQRPSDTLFDQGALDGLIAARITAVFNLTEPGEHPYCGTGILEETGFPYSPERLMKAGIKHFNFHWQDMTAPSVAKMMEIAHIGANEINSGGKIAVHCHAGYGRTGMAIACILIFKDQVESAQVIQFIRNRRPGSIQTTIQERFINKFERAHRFLMQVFPTKESLELSGFTDLHKATVLTSTTVSSPTVPTYSTATSLYLKTLHHSIKDQQYLLTIPEVNNRQFLWTHKIVFYTTASLQCLCQEMIQLTYLGITGLNKLVPKENNSHKFTSNLSKGNMNFLIGAPSYMVATNSMSQKLEETLLTDIKMEINVNKWTRFLAVAEVVSISLQIGHESVKRLTKVASHLDEKSPPQSQQGPPLTSIPSGVSLHQGSSSHYLGANGTVTANSTDSAEASTGVIHQVDADLYPELAFVGESPSSSGGSTARDGIYGAGGVGSIPNPFENRTRSTKSASFRSNSMKENNSEAEYNKSKRVSANIMSQLLLDWLETRQNAVFESTHMQNLQTVWTKHYPNFGQLGWATPAWKDVKNRTRAFTNFHTDLLHVLRANLDRCKLEVLSSLVQMYRVIHIVGVSHNTEEGEAEAPSFDTLVALRLAIALMHGRKLNHTMVRNRSLSMELVKLFMLKHADAEPVIINNITFAQEHATTAQQALGDALVGHLEVLVRTLLVLQEVNWSQAGSAKEKVHWREGAMENYVSPFVDPSLDLEESREL